MVSAYLKTKEHLHDSGLNRVKAALRPYIRYLSDREVVKSVQFDLLLVPTRLGPTDRTWLTPAELLSVIEAAESGRDRIALVVGADLCLRANELANIRLSDVDLVRGGIIISVLKARAPKPVFKKLRADTLTWLAAYLEGYISEYGYSPNYFLFPAYRAGPGAGAATCHRIQPSNRLSAPAVIVHNAVNRAGLTVAGNIGWHLIRRTSAKAWYHQQIAAGISPAVAQETLRSFLSHHDVAQTMHYIGEAYGNERIEAMQGLTLVEGLHLAAAPTRRTRLALVK